MQLHISFCDNMVIVDSVSHSKVYHTMDLTLTKLSEKTTQSRRVPALLFGILVR